MADKKISALTAATTPLAGTEVLPIVQGGATVKVSVANLTAGRSPSMSYAITNNGVIIQNGGVNRWILEREAGAGDSLYVYRYNDAGSYAGNPLRISRSNGVITWENGLAQGSAGTGINFTANTPAAGMTSQLLNWYEEGTWTGALVCGTSGTITLNASFKTGSYTRVGRLVTVTGLFYVDSVSSPVGSLSLTGLPYPINSGGAYARTAAAVSATGLAATATTAITGRGLAGESQIQLHKYVAGSIADLAGDVQADSQFYVSMSYITN